jgi:hypothetical protein
MGPKRDERNVPSADNGPFWTARKRAAAKL